MSIHSTGTQPPKHAELKITDLPLDITETIIFKLLEAGDIPTLKN